MIYSKPPLNLEAQADLLIRRGMHGDRSTMVERLAAVNYYRLSGYWHTFRLPDETFRPGTSFETVWALYVFDRHLRLLVMDAIGHIEIALRTQLAYHHAHTFGPFGYAEDPRSLPGLYRNDREEYLERVRGEVDRSKEAFVRHFRQKYGDRHVELPIWMVTEVLSFGSTLTMYRCCPKPVADAVADAFAVPSKVLSSWLLTLSAVRNICAHHGRLWNRVLGVKPLIPRPYTHPEWHTPVGIPNERIFSVLTICRYCLHRLNLLGKWPARLQSHIADGEPSRLTEMGFPKAWKDSPLWAGERNGTTDGRTRH